MNHNIRFATMLTAFVACGTAVACDEPGQRSYVPPIARHYVQPIPRSGDCIRKEKTEGAWMWTSAGLVYVYGSERCVERVP